jgi:hypothetical protein
MSCVVEYYPDMGHYMRRIILNSSLIHDEDILDITDTLTEYNVESILHTHNGFTTRRFNVINSCVSGIYHIQGLNINITTLFT